jgi:regulator of RNase E activity RraA
VPDLLVTRLALLDSCAVSDAMDSLGFDGVIAGLSQLSAPRRFAGKVLTVKLGPADGRASPRHLGTTAIDEGSAGDVIVIEHGRTDAAGWGGILSLAACQKGIAGIVIDGACRDIDEARELGLPVVGRAVTPRTARGRVVEYACGEPVQVAGVAVCPGDYLLADASGVVVVPRDHAEAVIATAERIVRKERLMAEQVRAGRPSAEVMGRNYEDMLSEGDDA